MRYLAAFLLSTLAMSAGCTGPCDRALHSSGLVVSVENIEASFSYRVELEADGALLVVEYAVDADHRLMCSAACEASAGGFVMEPEFGFGLDGTTATEVRFAVHRAGDQDDGPDDVKLRLYRDTQLAHQQSLRPAYRTSEPSGEGCGEVAFALVHAPLAP